MAVTGHSSPADSAAYRPSGLVILAEFVSCDNGRHGRGVLLVGFDGGRVTYSPILFTFNPLSLYTFSSTTGYRLVTTIFFPTAEDTASPSAAPCPSLHMNAPGERSEPGL